MAVRCEFIGDWNKCYYFFTDEFIRDKQSEIIIE
jgi:hypothetical protein